MEGFQKPEKTHTRDPLRLTLGVIRYQFPNKALCSCGWNSKADRPKVLEDHIDNHAKKRHPKGVVRL